MALRATLTQPLRAGNAQILGTADQRQFRSSPALVCKPVQDLNELELVGEIVLEPEHHFVVVQRFDESTITL